VGKFILKILTDYEDNIAISVEQILDNGTSPLTSYFFWPRQNAWEDLRIELEKKAWIPIKERTKLLDEVAKAINSWQVKRGETPTHFPGVKDISTDSRLDKGFMLSIDVNANASSDAVALEISNLCKALSAYHIACGGTGLTIDDWEIFVLATQLVGV
jgi:30S ribosomal protein 3